MKLVYTRNQKEVKIGDKVTLHGDADEVKVENIQRPRHAGSTGRVGVRFTEGGQYMEYYPTVIDAEWIEREDRQ